jgi:hypothetical protein
VNNLISTHELTFSYRATELGEAVSRKVFSPTMVDLTSLFAGIEYWRGLWSSDDFRGQTLANCIEVIHADILGVWNLPNKDRVCPFFFVRIVLLCLGISVPL